MSTVPLAAFERSEAFTVEVSSDIYAVQAQWEALENEGTPFQTRRWLIPFYRIVAPKFGATPLFVTVRDKETKRAVVFIPLWLRRWRGVKTIEFPDLNTSDYNSALVASDLNLTAGDLRSLKTEIGRALPDADIVRLDKVPATIFGRDNPMSHLSGMQQMQLHGWLLKLPSNRAIYDADILSRKVRKEHNRKRRRLNEQVGDFALIDAATPADAEEIFEALRAQRRARFGRKNILEDPCFLSFYRAVIFGQADHFVSLSALRAGEKIQASLLALRHRGAYVLLMHSFEPTLEAISPGIVAIDEMVSHRIQAGDQYFDFTVGNEDYKRQFGVHEVALVSGLYPMSLLGRAYAAALPLASRGRAVLRGVVRLARDLIPKPQ